MVDAHNIPTLASGIVLGALAAWVLALNPRDRVHRAFCLLLLCLGLVQSLFAVQDGVTSLPARLMGYVLIATPFAAINFSLLFHRYCGAGVLRARRGVMAARTANLVALVGFELWYLIDPYALVERVPPYAPGPLWVFLPLREATFALLAFVAALAYHQASEARIRRALIPFIAGFATAATFPAVHFLLQALQGNLGASDWTVRAEVTLDGLVLVLVGAAILLAARTRRVALLVAAGPAVMLIAGLAYPTSPQGTAAGWLAGLRVLQGLAFTLGAILLAYAVVRYRLFFIDLRIKAAVQGGTMAAPFAAAYFLASEGLEQLVPVDGFLLGIGAAALIGLAFRSIRRGAERLSGALMPGVKDDERYRAKRALELYEAAWDRALQDGRITPEERDALAVLRSGLGIPHGRARAIEGHLAGTYASASSDSGASTTT